MTPPKETLVINGNYFDGVAQRDMWNKLEADLKRLHPGDVILLDRNGEHFDLYREARQFLATRAVVYRCLLRFANPLDLDWAQCAVGQLLQYIPDKDAYTIIFDKDGKAQRPKR